jgi:hypothetical protein
MTDFASIGIQLDSRPVVEGTKALDALGEASARVEQKVRVSNGQMSDTAKIMQLQADQAKAAAQANAVLGNSTSALTLGQVQLIERFREQAAVVGMSRSQLMAYQAAQLGVTEQTRESIAIIKAQEDAVKAAAQAKADAANKANILSDALKLLAGAYAALKVADYVKDSAMMAARYETLGVVLATVGKTAGYTSTQMEHASQEIAAQGITMLESRNSAIKLVQAHVDLRHATALARGAQDAAVIGNINSSEAFDRLVNGISRGNVLILRNLGINVNLQAAYAQMAESLGKSTKELSENERVQARTGAVMERLTDIHGVYTAAMDTASKQILSMTRYVDDLKVKFGDTFNEVLTVGVMGLTSGLKDANGEVSELAKNNQLEEWGHGIAKVFVGIAGTVDNAITYIQKFDAFARHMDARTAIGRKYDSQVADTFFTTDALAHPIDAYNKGKRIDASRQAELAEEDARHAQEQAGMTGHFNRMDKAYDEFSAHRLGKKKADAAARLKVDQDYEKAQDAILAQAAGKGAKAQADAQKQLADLYQKTYVGTPTYRDTEGRDPKPKVDQADNTALENHLARLQDASAADKEYAEYQMRLDDIRRKAGELGDSQYFLSRKDNLKTIYLSEQEMYNQELAALRAHHSSTEAERAKNQKAIDDILGKQSAAQTKYFHDGTVMDEEERARQQAVESASQDAMNAYLSGLNGEAEKLEQSNGAHEKSRSAIERETVARLDLSIAAQQQFMAQQASAGATPEEVAQAKVILKYLEDMRVARQRLADGYAQKESDLFSKKAADQAIQDWQRAGASISDSLTNAFGEGGKAISKMFKAYAEGQAGQLRAQKDLAAARRLSADNPEKIDAINRAYLSGAQAQVKSYGDMADAAQGFFDQGSKGYAAMHAASQVLHGAEVALSLVKGVNAVLTQGEGDPYSAFARMAAMAALVTGLGVALSGGRGGADTTAADRQAAQGASTVLGDGNAKSESIARAVQLAAANSSTQIDYLSGMLTSLRAIETNIGSFASQIVSSTDIADSKISLNSNNGLATTATNAVLTGTLSAVGSVLLPGLGSLIGSAVGWLASKSDFIGKIATSVFGGKQSVEDSGFTLDKASLAGLLAGGAKASQYADIKTSGGWFSSDDHDTKKTPFAADADAQFTLIVKSMADSVTEAGKLLGMSGAGFEAQLNNFVVDIGKVSLKGMTGDEIQKALESVFSKLGDQMAAAAVGGLQQFQKVGEGYLETLVRVASDYAKVDASLQSIGKTFGSVGMQSIAAREGLITLMGGIDQFQSQTASFGSNFLTKQEQLAPVSKYVDDQLAALGLSYVKTRDQFKDVALGQDLNTAAGQKLFASLMGLESAFAATHAAAVDLTKTEQEVADERKDLQDQLDQVTMTQAQLAAKARNALAEVNRPLYDLVQTAQKLADTATNMEKFRDAAKSLNDTMLTGSLSVLTPEQQEGELHKQYEATKAAAMAGDTKAQDGVFNALTAWLTASQKLNGGDSTYQADFAEGQQDTAAFASWATHEVDTAQAQLAAMNSQTDALQSANGMLAAANTILTTISQNTAPVASAASPLATALSAMNTLIKSVQTEVAGLRKDQNVQTGDQIGANAEGQQAIVNVLNKVATTTTVKAVEKVTLE